MDVLIIEWSGSAAVVSRFSRRRGELLFQGSESRQAATDGGLAATLGEFLPSVEEDSRIVLAVSPTHVFTREMELPIRDRRKLRDVLPLEMKGETALDTDELVFDAVSLAGGKVLAVWARTKELSSLIRGAAEAGAEPEIVTVSPFHWRFILPEEGRSGCVALTDGEALAVFKDGEPCFFRALAQTGEISATLAALEIGKGVRAEKVYLLGPATRTGVQGGAGTVPFLPLPVEGALAGAFGDETGAREAAGTYAVARALLAGEAVNFRSGELAYTREREKFRRQLRVPAVLAAVLVLLLFADAGVRFYLVRKDLASVNDSIGAVYREVFPGRKKAADEVAELRAEIRKLGSGSGGSEVLATLKKLSEAKGDDVTGLYEVEIDGAQLRARGDARSIQAVTDFKNRLGAVLSSAEVGEVKTKPDGNVGFSIRGALKEGGK